MKDELFEDLVASVREMGTIQRGEIAAARVTELVTPNAREVRENLGFSQEEFARVLRVSVGTIRNWEQNRRQPSGPARVLLTIVQQHPDVLKSIAH